MELGLVPRHANPDGSLVPADRGPLVAHVQVQGAPGRLGQAGQPGYISVKLCHFSRLLGPVGSRPWFYHL